MKSKPKVIVAGATGRMGLAAVRTFAENEDKFELVGALVRDTNSDAAKTLQIEFKKLNISSDLKSLIKDSGAEILVELTSPESVFEHTKFALENGLRVVVGATGLSDKQIDELGQLAHQKALGLLIAPNFAIGAILMMQFAKKAAEYFGKYEIIEMHHDKKLDAPSGTAIKTAKLMNPKGEVPIHSVRLPGLLAHQEVIFGCQGQTLTVRHDTMDRSCFMPGILLSCEKVMELGGLVYGLDNLI